MENINSTDLFNVLISAKLNFKCSASGPNKILAYTDRNIWALSTTNENNICDKVSNLISECVSTRDYCAIWEYDKGEELFFIDMDKLFIDIPDIKEKSQETLFGLYKYYIDSKPRRIELEYKILLNLREIKKDYIAVSVSGKHNGYFIGNLHKILEILKLIDETV